MIGAFSSLDLFFFYAFHELALIPTFLLIGIWGSGNRVAAASASKCVANLFGKIPGRLLLVVRDGSGRVAQMFFVWRGEPP